MQIDTSKSIAETEPTVIMLADERWGMIVKVALDCCVASAGVIFAKKAGLPQLLAGSIRSQGVEFPPHSKFVVFTAPCISYSNCRPRCSSTGLEWTRRQSVTHKVLWRPDPACIWFCHTLPVSAAHGSCICISYTQKTLPSAVANKRNGSRHRSSCSHLSKSIWRSCLSFGKLYWYPLLHRCSLRHRRLGLIEQSHERRMSWKSNIAVRNSRRRWCRRSRWCKS